MQGTAPADTKTAYSLAAMGSAGREYSMENPDIILFPSSFFSVNRVDEDLQKEYEAARATGLFDILLFGYENWYQEGKLVLTETPDNMRTAILRGWMMKPEQYERFYQALLEHQIRLVTNPEAYRLMHIFPNIYQQFKGDTARMLLYPLREQIPLEEVKKTFRRFMVKDYVKSVKGMAFPRYFDETITQEAFDRWMETFYQYRGSLLTGGICIKEYLDLKFYGDRPNEYRVFYADRKILSICRNSGQGNYTAEPPIKLLEKYKNLPSPYYTVDYAELVDGTWKVMEAGDGSVSGLSEGQDAEHYFRALYYAFQKDSQG